MNFQMNSRVNFKLLATAVAAIALFGSAQAATYNYAGDTTGAPTYNRLLVGLSGLSSVGTAVAYQTFSFQVDTAGSYDFLSVTSPTWDNFLFLYKTSFNPAAPLVNAVAGNDDFPGLGIGTAGFSFALTTGTSYTVVTTAFGNANFGAYANSITGPGTVLTAAVPEPASYALLALGLGAIGWSTRRRQAQA
jgi:hypothetical protein